MSNVIIDIGWEEGMWTGDVDRPEHFKRLLLYSVATQVKWKTSNVVKGAGVIAT